MTFSTGENLRYSVHGDNVDDINMNMNMNNSYDKQSNPKRRARDGSSSAYDNEGGGKNTHADPDWFSETTESSQSRRHGRGRGRRRRNIYANSYNDTTKRFRGFFNLMCTWKRSVIKLIWHDLFVFVVAYALLSVLYRTVLARNPVHKELFEVICIYASKFRGFIPITFLTGFYVTQVVSRYWDQFMSLPWTDRLALKLVSYIPGQDPFRRNLRRTVMRYVNLSIVLVFRLVSEKAHARFPSFASLVQAKLMTRREALRLRRVDQLTPHECTWAPISWALRLIERARSDGQISLEAPVFSSLVASFDFVEDCNRKILNHGWVNFPLAYTQVATISVFAYFFASLFASQYLEPSQHSIDGSVFPHLNITISTKEPFSHHTPDLYVPFFTLVEFISYMGWIKVAETLLNPFGDDDEDFQINYLIDRNLQVSYMIVDESEEMHGGQGDVFEDVGLDPFLEAGIQIPPELPYRDERQRDEASRGDEDDSDGVAGVLERLRKWSRAASTNQIVTGGAGGAGGAAAPNEERKFEGGSENGRGVRKFGAILEGLQQQHHQHHHQQQQMEENGEGRTPTPTPETPIRGLRERDLPRSSLVVPPAPAPAPAHQTLAAGEDRLGAYDNEGFLEKL